MGEVSGGERRAMGDAGAAPESLLPLALDLTRVVVFGVDRDGRVVLSHGGGLSPLGLRSGEIVGRSVWQLYAGVPWILDSVRRALSGESFTVTGAVEGTWFESRYVPWRGPDGDVIGVLGCAVDATDRVHAAEILDNLGAVVWIADATTLALRFVSRQIDRPVSEQWRATADFFQTRLHPGEREVTMGLLRAVAADGKPRQAAHRLIASDGRTRWYLTHVRGLRPEAGAPAQIIGSSVDITERMRADQILTERQTMTRLLLEQLPAIIWTTDRELRFSTSAGAGLATLGLHPDQLAGVSIFEYFHTSDPNDANIAPIRRVLETGQPASYEAEWIGHDYQVHIEPFRDWAGEVIGTVGIALDVSGQRQAQRERDALLERERAARVAAEEACRVRDDFLSIASHELHTPITALQLAVQRARQRVDPETQGRMLSLAEAQIQRLVRLVDQLLDVSRIHGGRLDLERRELDLGALVQAVLTRARPEVEAAACRVELSVPEPVIGRFDQDRMEQVVTNLLSNALKYGARGAVEVLVERQGSTARVAVRDHGVGVAADRLPFIFERFERAVSARQYGGLGLGLYIVKRIVTAHGGTVSVASLPGQGATFTVELPL